MINYIVAAFVRPCSEGLQPFGEVVKCLKAVSATSVAVCVLCLGCVVPQTQTVPASPAGVRPERYVEPARDGYYTGANHHFEARKLPGSLSRRFKVARLTTLLVEAPASVECIHAVAKGVKQPIYMADAAAAIQKRMNQFAFVMTLREQAVGSLAYKAVRGESGSSLDVAAHNLARAMLDAFRADAELAVNNAKRANMFPANSLGEEKAIRLWDVYRKNPSALTAELAHRYPNAFSTASDAFPLDIVICGAWTKPGFRISAPVYEAFALGLPEHAQLAGWQPRNNGGVFETSEAFADPVDAVAAAVFRLSAEQLDGLQPMNPNDGCLFE